ARLGAAHFATLPPLRGGREEARPNRRNRASRDGLSLSGLGGHVARNHDILVIGASAGGVHALQQLASGLPRGLPAALMVAMHLPGDFRSERRERIDKAGPLAADFARDYQTIEHGRIYIAPPDRHLLIYGDTLRLGQGPRENHARPAIDPMFRSAAV